MTSDQELGKMSPWITSEKRIERLKVKAAANADDQPASRRQTLFCKAGQLGCNCLIYDEVDRTRPDWSKDADDVSSQPLFTVFFCRVKKCSFSESSSSVFRLVTRKESDLQLFLDVKAARSWKKSWPNSIRWLTKMCCFAVSIFFDTAATVQNYSFVGFWKILYLRTNRDCCRWNWAKPAATNSYTVATSRMTKSRRIVQLLCHSFLTGNSDLQRAKPGNTHECLSRSVSSRLKGKLNAWEQLSLTAVLWNVCFEDTFLLGKIK